MQKYRFVGRHADHLADGRPLEPGQIVNIKKAEEDDPLIEAGVLVLLEGSEEPEPDEDTDTIADDTESEESQ